MFRKHERQFWMHMRKKILLIGTLFILLLVFLANYTPLRLRAIAYSYDRLIPVRPHTQELAQRLKIETRCGSISESRIYTTADSWQEVYDFYKAYILTSDWNDKVAQGYPRAISADWPSPDPVVIRLNLWHIGSILDSGGQEEITNVSEGPTVYSVGIRYIDDEQAYFRQYPSGIRRPSFGDSIEYIVQECPRSWQSVRRCLGIPIQRPPSPPKPTPGPLPTPTP